jgi:predicted ribosome quality control (RQC) complex YloA/Tae2 family protein
VDVFAPTPLITVEEGELPVHVEPGFVRAAGAALRGKTLTSVRSRTGDRSLRFEFASRSRFGIEDRYALICELVPKFGNIIVVKNVQGPSGGRDVVVAAAKEFAPADNAVRSIQVGALYEPAPLPIRRNSRILSEDALEKAAAQPGEGDLHVYRRDGALVQAHIVPLPQYADLDHQRAASLLDLLAEARSSQQGAAQNDRVEKLRRSLERRLAERSAALQRELEEIEHRLQTAAGNERLRTEGEGIYASLHELPDVAQRERAKERASQLFAQYKKNTTARTHLKRRASELSEQLDELADLRWEVERAEADDLPDAAQAVEGARSSTSAKRSRPSLPSRRPMMFETAGRSRIYVGRTPLQNADLTFRLARPADLWFHVQNQPGAHVILQRDDRQEPPQEDILAAAALAALHSKAKNSPKVTVDYTQRKFVRKRPGAAPGLVFYTNPRSVLVAPASPQR